MLRLRLLVRHSSEYRLYSVVTYAQEKVSTGYWSIIENPFSLFSSNKSAPSALQSRIPRYDSLDAPPEVTAASSHPSVPRSHPSAASRQHPSSAPRQHSSHSHSQRSPRSSPGTVELSVLENSLRGGGQGDGGGKGSAIALAAAATDTASSRARTIRFSDEEECPGKIITGNSSQTKNDALDATASEISPVAITAVNATTAVNASATAAAVRNSTPSKSESKIGLDVELFLAGFGEAEGHEGRNGELMAVLEGKGGASGGGGGGGDGV